MKYLLSLSLFILFFSCTNSTKVFQQVDNDFSIDLEILSKKLNQNSSNNNAPDRVLLPEYRMELTNENGFTYHAIAYYSKGRVYPNNNYQFNESIITDENYNIKDLKVFEIGNVNKVFTTDISSIITSYLWNDPSTEGDNHIVLEYDDAGNFIVGKEYGQVGNAYDFWKPCEINSLFVTSGN